jgi:hypothetical protein
MTIDINVVSPHFPLPPIDDPKSFLEFPLKKRKKKLNHGVNHFVDSAGMSLFKARSFGKWFSLLNVFTISLSFMTITPFLHAMVSLAKQKK